MNTPEDDLRLAIEEARASAAAQVPFHACAESLFEGAVTPLARLRQHPLDAVQTALVGEVVSTMLDLGRKLFEADRYSARKLGEILSWAKHLAGIDGAQTWDTTFENLQRDWNWQSH